MIAVRRSRTKGERHQKYGGQHHACHQQIGVLPAELVCHPCRHVVAELHDAEDVAVEHRHQQRPGMVVLKGVLRRIRLILHNPQAARQSPAMPAAFFIVNLFPDSCFRVFAVVSI